jgi:mono/diheme cytochrome c family protein
MAALAACLTLPGAAFAADPAAGRALAEEWCVRCHNIEKGAPFKLRPPSFASIAVYRPDDDIRDRILAPHVSMPDVQWMLDVADIDHLAAYIASLEPE